MNVLSLRLLGGCPSCHGSPLQPNCHQKLSSKLGIRIPTYRFGETPCPSQGDTPLSSYPIAVGKLKQKQPKEERVHFISQSKDHQEGKARQPELGAAGRIAFTVRRVVNVCCPSVPFLYSQSPVSQPVDGTTHRRQAFLPQERQSR